MAKVKGNTTPDFAQVAEEPKEELTPTQKEDNFLQELAEIGAKGPVVTESKGFNIAEPEGELLIVNASFFNWRDENDKPHIGKVFVGQYLGEHKNPARETDFTANELLGYDFKGIDGVDYILGDNYSLSEALETEKEVALADGTKTKIKIKDLNPKPVLWIKLIGVAAAKKGDFNQFKIKLVPAPTKTTS